VTETEKLKSELHSSVKRLTELQSRTEEALRKRCPLSPQDYQALLTLSGSHDLQAQLTALDEATDFAEAELIKVWRTLAETDYGHFYEFMNRDEGYELSKHQRLIADLLMRAEAGELMRGMVSMPPGHCKSTHCSHHFPAWYFGRNPRRRFLQAGHSQDFVENEMGAKVRDIINSEDYGHIFPDIHIRTDMKAKAYWGLSNRKGKYVGKGVGQGISGFRGDFGSVDDPYKTRQDAESQTTRDKVFKWYTDDFQSRLLPWAPLFIVSTRWHSDDVCGRIEEEELKKKREAEEALIKELSAAEQIETFNWEIINLPALAEDDDVLGRQTGEALWPELYDESYLLKLKGTMESSSFNSLYQGTPIDVEGTMVSKEWFGRYDRLPDRKDVRKVILSVDAANTAKERSDYSVILVWFQDTNRRHYLADVIRKKVELPQLTTLIENTYKQWNADGILVEAKGNGLSYIQNMRAPDAKAPGPIIPIEVQNQTKEFRFDKVTTMIQAGEVYLPSRAMWLPDYEKELIAFPHGKHDDQVDATSQYLDWAKNKGKRGTRKLGGTGHR
jgi:predicted phage terminase large subunit-like protein